LGTKYLTTNEASKIINLAKSTVYAYASKNKIPHYKIGGKILFTNADLISWIKSKKIQEEK
jgi:excisionase family DNA binding protein